MTHITCRLTAKNRDQLRNPTLGNRVWATFTFLPAAALVQSSGTWLDGNTLVLISGVAQRRARLLAGWVADRFLVGKRSLSAVSQIVYICL